MYLINILFAKHNKIQKEVLPFIMTMLLHPYPRVRRHTAEQLYIKLVEDGDVLFDNPEHLEKTNQLILTVVWHEETDPSGQLTDTRNYIADLLDISLTPKQRIVKIAKKGSSSKSVLKDEFESYSSLVNNA